MDRKQTPEQVSRLHYQHQQQRQRQHQHQHPHHHRYQHQPFTSSLPIYNHKNGGGNHQYGDGNYSQQLSSNHHNHLPATTSRSIPNHTTTTVAEGLIQEGYPLVDSDIQNILDGDRHRAASNAAHQRTHREKLKAKASTNNAVRDMQQAAMTKKIEVGQNVLHKNIEVGQNMLQNVLHKNIEASQNVMHENTEITSKLAIALANNANGNNGTTEARSSNYDDGQTIHHTDHDDRNRLEKSEDANYYKDQNQTNHPNNNQSKDCLASDRFPSMLPRLVFPEAKRSSKNNIIYSLSSRNKASNENADPNVSVSSDVHPLRVDMCQRGYMMVAFNICIHSQFPSDVVPKGVDAVDCIKNFAGRYKNSLHDFFHGNDVFDFTDQEKQVALEHTFSIVDSYIPPTGEKAYKNTQIKAAL
mmetsp:Transcript_30577/g.32980  ORF Transcript_30577/g.32980 Transcript_30577/m.32980 type:complete len:414 (-) Transcript_30577:588-1829(-)